jgi:sarcosine oxidase subunit gamma
MADTAQRRGPAIAGSSWLDVLPPAVRLSFYGDAAARAALAAPWGAALSEQALRAAGDDARAALWLGPDEYLLIDRVTTERGGAGPGVAAAALLVDTLEAALGGLPHAIVDISHRQVGLMVRGPHAEAILCGACPLDLDIAEFPVGMCTRTVLAKAEIVLWRTERDAFQLEVWRSFAAYVTGLLNEIAVEYVERP